MKSKIENNDAFRKLYFEALQSNPYLPVFWVDAGGCIFKINDAVTKYLDYTEDELTGKHVSFIDAAYSPEEVGNFIKYLRTKMVNRFATQHRNKYGKVIDVEIISGYHKIDGEEFSINYIFDISEKVKLEKNLLKTVDEKTAALSKKVDELQKSEELARQNEEMFINAFRTSQDAINLNDIDSGVYIQINNGFSMIMGYTPEEVVGKSSLDLNIWKNPEARHHLIDTVKKYGFCHNYEADFLRKDGTIVHGIMSASIHEYRGKKVLLNVSKDITKIKRLENELKDLNTKLTTRVEEEVAMIRKQQEIIFEQKKLADMGMMINAIAHQWRQPLNIIGLRTQNIADSYRDKTLNDEEIAEFEEKQMSTLDYLSSTIDDFRTFFKPDDKESEFDVSNEIVALLRLVEIQMLAKNIKPFVSYSSPTRNIKNANIAEIPRSHNNETVVKGYRGEFKQVITNLVYNSIFAIEERIKAGEKTEGHIHVRMNKTGNQVIINIEDTGGGIGEDVKPHIFNPYFTTKEEGKGTGLGLYLAKLIIHNHMNGTITVANTSLGANFEIILPAVN
ncbi:MAG: PAS domain S-box protein [Deferribacterales bacterium]